MSGIQELDQHYTAYSLHIFTILPYVCANWRCNTLTAAASVSASEPAINA
jgi:hypothetical protein